METEKPMCSFYDCCLLCELIQCQHRQTKKGNDIKLIKQGRKMDYIKKICMALIIIGLTAMGAQITLHILLNLN